MNISVVSICNERREGLEKLLASTSHFGYINHSVVIEPTKFGDQMPILYRWCKANADKFSHIIYSDAWDTFFVSDINEFLFKLPTNIKMFCSGEKVCFPNEKLAVSFPEAKTAWRFICGGNFFVEVEFFIHLFENHPSTNINDQEWLSMMFLNNQDKFSIDYNCSIFQPLAFSSPEELVYDYKLRRLINQSTLSLPVILHGNARTSMTNAYKLLEP